MVYYPSRQNFVNMMTNTPGKASITGMLACNAPC